ncbi:hypothetical protein B0H11DRAFT_2219268 [Mycena galericulata]|nr:hypothetical protein B0H11DRAFT_2219268 [Mycena galericulata]
MALVVPILRLLMLLLNIYETFKVLKPPRLSRRNSGQPTVRALSQRKRTMKGCLAVWIVWCCFMTYERMAEPIVSLFIPFYDEFKSLVLLFLILTRARGAEPIYLHIIRPLLRPYTSTVDALFDVARMFGDIIFLLSTYPFQLLATWWQNTFTHPEPPVEEAANGGLYAEVQQALHSVSYQLPAQPGGRRRSSGPIRDDFHAVNGMIEEQNVMPRPRFSAGYVDGLEPAARGQAHEIWHPPRSAYQDEDEDNPLSLVPDLETEENRRERERMEEWRQYPPFPSAYPPTPLPASSSRLPLPSVPASSFVPRNFSPIVEDQQSEQDFGQSLPSPHELSNPGSVGGVSDEDNVLGIQAGPYRATPSQDNTMDEDEEEDDDFDVTLRTPGPLVETQVNRAPMTRSKSKQSSSSSDALETPLALPSLLSRISSDMSSVSSESSTTSLVGQKRSREFIVSAHAPKSPVPRGTGNRRSAHSIDGPLEIIDDESSSVSTTSDDDEDDVDADTSGGVSEPKSPLMKRRRVANVSPPIRVQPRRTTRTTSQEPPIVAAPPPRRQRQPNKSEAPSGSRASSRLANSAPAAQTMPRRQETGATADPDGHLGASKVSRPSRRAMGGENTVAAKRR